MTLQIDNSNWLFPAAAGFKIGSSIMGGVFANRAAQYRAAALRQAAGQEQAASQRDAINAQRNKELLISSAIAKGAASGAPITDAGSGNSLTQLIGQIASQGDYNTRVALYQGNERARALQTQADVAGYQGKAAQTAGIIQGFTTALMGGETMYRRYNNPTDKSAGVDSSDGNLISPYDAPQDWGGPY